ncbi:MAG: alpha/beta hydrolase [Chloroflexi bacterium]|nr:alpha/beta hydrolase [Chloroflexota bacterium]
MRTTIRNLLAGIGAGGIFGAVVWGATELWDISDLLAWVVAGAAVGGVETVVWLRAKRSLMPRATPSNPAQSYFSNPSVRVSQGRTSMKKILATVTGLVFFGVVTAIHGVTATAASSIIFLGVLWLFTPAPLVFLARMWRPWRRFRRLSTVYLVTSVVLSVLVLAGVGWIGSERGIHPSLNEHLPKLEDYPHLREALEEVGFQSSDGTLIKGWFIPGDSDTTIILLHGFLDIRDKMLPHADFLHRAGYSVLLFDMRSKGESEGDAVTLGYYERDDVKGAVDYLKSRPDVNSDALGVLGVSMGGATAILAAAEIPELKAVVSESAFKSVDSAIASSFEHFIHLPAFPFAPITVFIIEQRLGLSTDQVVPEVAVGRISPRPLFLIHGQDDVTIRPEDARALFAAAGEPKEGLWLIPGSGHAEGAEVALEEYSKRVVDFFDRYLER